MLIFKGFLWFMRLVTEGTDTHIKHKHAKTHREKGKNINVLLFSATQHKNVAIKNIKKVN